MKLRKFALLTAALGLSTGAALAQEITLKVHHFLPPSSNASRQPRGVLVR